MEQSILDLNPFHTESKILKFADSFRHDLAENLALKQTWQKEQETGLEMCFQIFIFFKLTSSAAGQKLSWRLGDLEPEPDQKLSKLEGTWNRSRIRN